MLNHFKRDLGIVLWVAFTIKMEVTVEEMAQSIQASTFKLLLSYKNCNPVIGREHHCARDFQKTKMKLKVP